MVVRGGLKRVHKRSLRLNSLSPRSVTGKIAIETPSLQFINHFGKIKDRPKNQPDLSAKARSIAKPVFWIPCTVHSSHRCRPKHILAPRNFACLDAGTEHLQYTRQKLRLFPLLSRIAQTAMNSSCSTNSAMRIPGIATLTDNAATHVKGFLHLSDGSSSDAAAAAALTPLLTLVSALRFGVWSC